MPKKISAHIARQISVAASCEPDSVHKYVSGKPLKIMVVERIEAALPGLGLSRYQRPRAEGNVPPGNLAISSVPGSKA